MMSLLMHHSLRAAGSDHVTGPARKPSPVSLAVEEHGMASVHPKRTHPLSVQHGQRRSVRGAAHFIAAWNLHTQQVGDGCYHAGDVLWKKSKKYEHPLMKNQHFIHFDKLTASNSHSLKGNKHN